jgi:GT2 family glycosyltransferase
MTSGPVSIPSTPDVVVAIVSHNTRSDLLACLNSLAVGGLRGVKALVVVTDNASTDGSPDAVARAHPNVLVVANTSNAGFGAATNQALRAAGFDVPGGARPRHALILNPDTVVPEGAVRGLCDVLDAERDLGAVGPKLVLPDGRLDLACRRGFPTPEVSLYRFLRLARLFPRSPRFGRYNMTFLDENEPADVDSLVGACMLVRGEALDAVGLFDERFWMYGEDLDLCLRLRQGGWRVAYRPAILIHHVKRAASKGSSRASFEFQRAMWLFYDKHYARSTPRPVHAAVLLALMLRGGPRLAREMARARGL